MQKSADLVYFSWTGKTKRVFEFLHEELEKRGWNVALREIKPKKDFPYPIWLFLSFIPNLGVGVEPLEVSSDVIFLGMPKWTINCPPVTAFLKKTDLRGKVVFLVITYGGFDEKRYARSVVKKIEGKGCRIPKMLLLRRRKIESGEFEKIVSIWLDEAESALEEV